MVNIRNHTSKTDDSKTPERSLIEGVSRLGISDDNEKIVGIHRCDFDRSPRTDRTRVFGKEWNVFNSSWLIDSVLFYAIISLGLQKMPRLFFRIKSMAERRRRPQNDREQ